MAESSRDQILKRIRTALQQPSPQQPAVPNFTAPLFAPPADELSIVFAESFVRAGGTFYYCPSEEHFFDLLYAHKQERKIEHLFVWEPELKKLLHAGGVGFVGDETDFLAHADAGLTTCEALVARTGSVLLSAATGSGRRLSIYPDQQLVLARASQVVADIKDALLLAQDKFGGLDKLPSMLSLVTGPSRTADIEKTLVLGAHGPRSITLFLLDDLPTA